MHATISACVCCMGGLVGEIVGNVEGGVCTPLVLATALLVCIAAAVLPVAAHLLYVSPVPGI